MSSRIRKESEASKASAMTETVTSCGCSLKLKLILQVVDCLALLLILVLQGSILDYYLILHNGGSAAWYFWFLADFLVLIAFMAAAVISYRYYRKKVKLRKASEEPTSNMPNGFPVGKLGSLPLAYITWFFYSALLTAKVVLLFKLGIAQTLGGDSAFGSQLLKVVIASAAVVFLLLVETHNDAEPHSDHQAYIYFLITSTVFEIFDSVTFLGILFPNDTKLVLPFHFESLVLGLSCVNFVLPTLALYKLSMSEFGLRPRPLGLQLLYKLLHLILINLPYLIIRIYLWTLYDHDVTLFLLKNILAVVLTLRTAIPDIHLWWQIYQESQRKHHICLDGAMELGVVYERTDEHLDEMTLNGDGIKTIRNTHV